MAPSDHSDRNDPARRRQRLPEDNETDDDEDPSTTNPERPEESSLPVNSNFQSSNIPVIGSHTPHDGQQPDIGLHPQLELEGATNEIRASATFHANSNLDRGRPDIFVLSSDYVLFAVHSHKILAASTNNFAHLILPTGDGGGTSVLATLSDPGTPAPLVPILATESSDILNVIFHSIYDLPIDMYRPSFDYLMSALPVFAHYGFKPLSKYVSRGTPLFNSILNHAPLHPIETYARAAFYQLEDLAVASSAYTLTMDLNTSVSNSAGAQMGANYLMKLIKLHGDRIDKLKEALDNAILYPHVATRRCSVEKRKQAMLTFKVACAQLYREATPGMSRAAIESIMRKQFESFQDCPDCLKSAEALLEGICTKWLLLERTI